MGFLRWIAIGPLLPLALLAVGIGRADELATGDVGQRWYGTRITVDGLPENGAAFPVSVRVDFERLMRGLDGVGIVDEPSLQLLRCDPDGTESEIPAQWSSDNLPRSPTRKFRADTVADVSYVTEFPPEDVAAAPPQIGTLTWFAQPADGGRAEYRLRFARVTQGRAVQVPYGPHNLRVFDDQNRATVPRHFPGMQIRPQWPVFGQLDVWEARRQVTRYVMGPRSDGTSLHALRRPFLYPLYDPDGYAITEFGKAHDPTGSHRHHNSLWIAHADVSGRNFWSDSGGIIAHEAWESLEDGPVFCRIAARNVWIDAESRVLCERRTMTFYHSSAETQLIDFRLEFQPAEQEPVRLGATTFGFLSVRTAQSMTPFDGGGEIVNAREQRNEQAAHRQRAEWIDLSGPVAQDQWSGIALLDHPGNPNHPTAWHCRNDGWACASFNHEHPYTIPPGDTLGLDYRVVVHRGNAADAGIAAHFRNYAARAEFHIGETRLEE